MDRITGPQDFSQWIEIFRAERAHIDDRRDAVDRDVVCYYEDPNEPGTWLPSALKVYDDVIVYGVPLRVIGPAQGRGNFAAAAYFMPEDTTPTVSTFALADITDRAPANPNEPGPHFPLIPSALIG